MVKNRDRLQDADDEGKNGRRHRDYSDKQVFRANDHQCFCQADANHDRIEREHDDNKCEEKHCRGSRTRLIFVFLS